MGTSFDPAGFGRLNPVRAAWSLKGAVNGYGIAVRDLAAAATNLPVFSARCGRWVRVRSSSDVGSDATRLAMPHLQAIDGACLVMRVP